MIQVIGQSVEAGNETGARQLFDVLETLLILVKAIYIFMAQKSYTISRKYLSSEDIYPNWFSSFSSAVPTVDSILNYAFLL